LKWTPSKTDDRRHGRAEHVAGISVLRQDKQDKQDKQDSWTSDRMTNSKNDSHTNAVDISDIENSLTDVS